jgi:hypothetical protein
VPRNDKEGGVTVVAPTVRVGTLLRQEIPPSGNSGQAFAFWLRTTVGPEWRLAASTICAWGVRSPIPDAPFPVTHHLSPIANP